MSDKMKYPLLLIHGMGFRDYKYINYWGRIPKALEEHGARIFYGGQDSNGSIESNARQLEKTVNAVLKTTGADKINIIAHSKGGLEARYLISTLGYGDKIASLTTIATPHNGSVTVDKLMTVPQLPVKIGCKAVDMWFRLLGDRSPDTYSAINAFKTDNAASFNAANPDNDKVYYQSYACVMKKCTSDIFMGITWLAVNHFEGENDGLLAPRAVKWTNFRGVYSGSSGRGISHCDEVDMRRHKLSDKNDGDISDICQLYITIAEDLKSKGF